MILTIIGAVLTIAFVVIATIFAQNVTTQTLGEEYTFPVMSFIGAIIFYAFALASFLSCSLPGLRFAAFQKQLNAKKIGNVSFIIGWVLFAVTIIATIVIIVVML